MRIFLLSLMALLIGCKEPLIHDLSEQQANKLLTLLNDIDIRANRSQQADGNWALYVAGEKKIKALKYIQDKRIFHSRKSYQRPSSGLILNPEEQRFLFERKLSSEIENTLVNIDGILDARVHLNLPNRDPILASLGREKPGGSGSVLVVGSESLKMDAIQIANLVGGASGIESKKISIVFGQASKEEENVSLLVNSKNLGSKEFRKESGLKLENNQLVINRKLVVISLFIFVSTLSFLFYFIFGTLFKRRKQSKTIQASFNSI